MSLMNNNDRQAVALLAEGVGRNCTRAVTSTPRAAVALLAEGVGRNKEIIQELNK